MRRELGSQPGVQRTLVTEALAAIPGARAAAPAEPMVLSLRLRSTRVEAELSTSGVKDAWQHYQVSVPNLETYSKLVSEPALAASAGARALAPFGADKKRAHHTTGPAYRPLNASLLATGLTVLLLQGPTHWQTEHTVPQALHALHLPCMAVHCAYITSQDPPLAHDHASAHKRCQ